LCLQPFEGFQSGKVRQADVKDDCIRTVFGKKLQSLGRRRGRQYDDFPLRKKKAKAIQRQRVVVNDEQMVFLFPC